MIDSRASIGTTGRLIATLLFPMMAGGSFAAGALSAGDAVPRAPTRLAASAGRADPQQAKSLLRESIQRLDGDSAS